MNKKQIDWKAKLAPIVVLAVIFIVCEWIASTGRVSEYILPAPSSIVTGIIKKLPGEIAPHFMLTLKVMLIGFISATFLGMLLAAIISQSGLVTNAVSPVIIFLVIKPDGLIRSKISEKA